MYTPAFLEIFVGLVAVLLWAKWLERRPAPPAVVPALPWIAGAAVLLGQVAAFYAIMTSIGAPDPVLVRTARWGSFGVVAGCLLVEVALTIRVLVQRTRNHHQASP
jgi:hypothetical protein